MKRPSISELQALVRGVFETQIKASKNHQKILAAMPVELGNLVTDVTAHVVMAIDLTIDEVLEGGNG